MAFAMVLHETTMYMTTEKVGVNGSLRRICREEAADGGGRAAERTGEEEGSLAVSPLTAPTPRPVEGDHSCVIRQVTPLCLNLLICKMRM